MWLRSPFRFRDPPSVRQPIGGGGSDESWAASPEASDVPHSTAGVASAIIPWKTLVLGTDTLPRTVSPKSSCSPAAQPVPGNGHRSCAGPTDRAGRRGGAGGDGWENRAASGRV